MPKFTDAPEVETLANGLITRYHPRLSSANIRYLFKDGDWEQGGKTILAQVKPVSSVQQAHFSSDLDFIMTVNGPAWLTLKPSQREALVDHELCHCRAKIDTETGEVIGWKTVPHDFDEFTAVVERHGLWQSDVRKMAQAMQPHLFDEDGRPALKVVGG